jgi:hypothetical protein
MVKINRKNPKMDSKLIMFDLKGLKPPEPFKISSVESVTDRTILVGDTSGYLHYFEYDDRDSTNSMKYIANLKPLAVCKGREITKIIYLKELKSKHVIAIVIANDSLFVVNLTTPEVVNFSKFHELLKEKQVQKISYNKWDKGKDPGILILQKDNVALFFRANSKASGQTQNILVFEKKINLPEAPDSMVWYKNVCIWGTGANQYTRAQYSTSNIIREDNNMGNPIKVIDEDEILYTVGAKDQELIGILKTGDNNLATKGTLNFRYKSIKGMVVGKMYIVVIRGDNKLMIFDKKTNLELQIYTFDHNGKELFWNENSEGRIYIATKDNVWYLKFYDYQRLKKSALENDCEEQAISIFEAHVDIETPATDREKMELYCEVAESYLRREKYDEAADSYKKSNFDAIEL